MLQMVDGEEFENVLTYAVNKMFLQQALNNPTIKGIFIHPELSKYFNKYETDKTVLVSKDPMKHFYQLHNDLYDNTNFYNNNDYKETIIPKSCKVSPNAIISNGVIIGENCVFKERCIVKSGTVIGNGVTIKEGAIVGGEIAETKMIDGKYMSIRHDAHVIIEDEAEIGINTIISRSLFGKNTNIGKYTRICDNVFISHGCQIGINSFIASGANLSGSVVVGDNGFISSKKISDKTLIIHISGNVNFERLNCKFIPNSPAKFGYMSFTTDFIDPKAIVDLHTAGFLVGEGMVKAHKLGLKNGKYDSFVQSNYPALAFKDEK